MVPIEELLGMDSGEDSDTPSAFGGPAAEAGDGLGAAEAPPPPPVEETYPDIVISEAADGKSYRANLAGGRLVAYKTMCLCGGVQPARARWEVPPHENLQSWPQGWLGETARAPHRLASGPRDPRGQSLARRLATA